MKYAQDAVQCIFVFLTKNDSFASVVIGSFPGVDHECSESGRRLPST